MTAIAFLFGLCIGSFINMCAYRMPRGYSLAYPRSRCGRCGFVVPWYDNLPVLSCLLLGARCRRCGVGFSFSHAVVELATGALAAAMFEAFGLTFFSVYYFVLLSALLLVSLIDLEFRIIPDEISIGGLVVGLATAAILSTTGLPWVISFRSSILGALFGAGILYGVGKAYETLTGKEGIGLGDVKLLALMGAHTGVFGVLSIVFLSSLTGSIVGIAYVLVRRVHTRTPIPFGPFLCAAFVAEVFFRSSIEKVCKVCIPFLV